MVVVKLFKITIFPRFGVPRVVISDGGSHFVNKAIEGLLRKHGVKHKIASPYHPQTSGQVESCHLPVELEYNALWAVKMLNFDIKTVQEKRLLQLHELEGIRLNAFESARIYKEKKKILHDQKILKREFKVADLGLEVRTYGALVLEGKDGKGFVLNGQRVKHYLVSEKREEASKVRLDDPPAC
ncbi:uncharacterized protein LOC112087280 [Eutrema salsugineum]|uniref:uncharacterized protein LOC112087280 n=1 Tax=Eutrema salsugineum TaxID=72664 RepID=UPI000CED338B|nr:uncharacterized protein LOC112087280 [Eutrema salsugineum]